MSVAVRDSGPVGVPLPLDIVGLKTAFDLVDRYTDRIEAYDEATDISFGFTYDPSDDGEVDDAVSEHVVRVRAMFPRRLFGRIPGLVRYPKAAVVGAFIGVNALLFATGRVWSVAVPLAAATLVVPFGVSYAAHWLRYAGVKYRIDGALL
jgi:hypothetical protein